MGHSTDDQRHYFYDRQEAGLLLAKRLSKYKGKDAVVLALPRGGIVLGAELSSALNLPLGLVLVRKIGHPSYPEYAIGAVAEEYQPIYSDDIEIEDIDQNWLNDAVKSARKLIDKRRQNYYGKDFQPPSIKGKIVIIVDDGIATGLTMQASIDAVRRQKPQQIILAVPVASYQSLDILEKLVDKVVVLDNPLNFLGAVGAHYINFEQVSDDQVRKLLRESYHAKNQA